MAEVSLILPTTPNTPLSPGRALSFQRALEEAGHRVEVLVVACAAEQARGDGDGADPNWRRIEALEPGLAAAAVAGLREATGEVLLVLDPAMGYVPGDLNRVVEPLATNRADLAIGSRLLSGHGVSHPRLRRALHVRALGLVVRPLTGTSDPMSGLIALRRSVFRAAAEELRPVGAKFAVELLARARGSWVEVPVQAGWPASGSPLGFDDLRQFKRLADHRFGNYSRLVQFCVVGASGMVVDLSCYAAFQWLFGHTWLAERTTPVFHSSLALTVSAVLAVWIALSWNFSLNRRLTFSYARHGSLPRQYVTYALSNALGILVSLSLRLALPRYFAFFNAHKLAAAVVGIVTATAISFSLSRWVVFRHHHRAEPGAGLAPVGAGTDPDEDPVACAPTASAMVEDFLGLKPAPADSLSGSPTPPQIKAQPLG